MSARTISHEAQGPVRFYPKFGQQLGRDAIRGEWWPSGSVECSGVFAVCWTAPGGRTYWAPLHAFDIGTRDQLIAECERQDRGRGARGW